MKRPPFARAVAHALIIALTGTLLLGSFTGTVAAAQTIQNSTYSYQYDANGNVTHVTDPRGNVTSRTYDTLNRVTSQLLPAPTAGVARPAIGTTYDGQDQLAKVTDPRSLVTRYTTDGLGNQTALASPDSGSSSVTYDAAGNVVTRTDARGITQSYSYDALNRLTGIAAPGAVTTTFEYDGGSTSIPAAIGQLTKITDASGSTVYGYGDFGRLVYKMQTQATGLPRTNLYAWGTEGSATGKLVSMTYPSGNRINYSYDAAGRVSALTLNAVNPNGSGTGGAVMPLLTGISYQPFGAVRSWTWGNSGDSTTPNLYSRSFDLDGRVTSYPLGHAKANGTVRTVNYDAAGRIISTRHAGSGTGRFAPANVDQNFSYDNLDRITGMVGTTTVAYEYDASGNRTAVTLGASRYNNTVGTSSNRLMATSGPVPAKTNTYDAAGYLGSDGTISHVTDARGTHAQVIVGGVAVTYAYNGLLQRVSKRSSSTALVPGGAQYYAYDEAGHMIGEYDANSAVVEETVYLGDVPVAVLKQATVAGVASMQVFYVYSDHIATPRVITRASNNQIVWRWDAADPFGLSQPDEDPIGLGAFVYNPRFPGQMLDRESNLHYNYYRDYDPQNGRYVQSDPIALNGGINTYGYVLGNPISNIDPLGLWSFTFGGYAGPGFQITFGNDNGNGFVTARVGFGAGGGFSYNPAGGIPGGKIDNSSKGGAILACTAKASFNAGPLQAGLEGGAARNYSNGTSSIIGPLSPSDSGRFSSGWLGGGSILNLNSNANVGGQITIYSGK